MEIADTGTREWRRLAELPDLTRWQMPGAAGGMRTASITIPIDDQYASAANGRVTVQYIEPSANGPLTIAETDAVLN